MLSPRPLALHLAFSSLTEIGALAALPAARAGMLPWHPALAADARALQDDLESAPADALAAALAEESTQRLSALHRGLQAYWHHPYRRALQDPPEVWREGTTRLLDYGGAGGAAHAGKTVLFVPSLVNRAYILDLSAGNSLLRWLSRQGLAPLLVDWGAPGPEESGFGLDDYVAGRLERALQHAADHNDGPVDVVGYCMGGTLLAALAQRRPDLIRRVVFLATPWDFHAGLSVPAAFVAQVGIAVEPVLQALGQLPVDLLQALFASLDPTLVGRKFRRFADLDPESEAAEGFVAIEDWANDGVPLAAPVARQCLAEWYIGNAPGRGAWRVAGAAIDPAEIRHPALVALPSRDRIVPPPSAEALAGALPNATVLRPASGHVAMVAGARAEAALWRPLAEWLRAA